MRLLAIDAGNTRIKWGVRDNGEWCAQGAFGTAEAAQLERISSELGPVDRVVTANVAGERVAAEIRGALRMEPLWVAGKVEQCGVRSGYADPAQLGADRWAALIGARRFVGGACVVVNAGTTLTVDALSAESIFLGGYIVAGLELMHGVLTRNTAQLRFRGGRFAFFPDNTGDAIASGALNALAGAIDRMVRYMVQAGEDEPVVILSGGDAHVLLPHLSGQTRLVDNLVLEGLAHIGATDV